MLQTFLYSGINAEYFFFFFFFFFFFVSFVLILVFADILNFRSVILLLLLVFHLFLGLIVRHLLIALLLHQKLNGIPDKLGMFLDHILDAFLFVVLLLILLQVQNDLSSAAQRLAIGVGLDGERTSG